MGKKRKRGSFSFLDASKSKPYPRPVVKMPKPHNGILITNTFATGVLERDRDTIVSIIGRNIGKKFLSGTVYHKNNGTEFLYVILNIEKNTSNAIRDIKEHFGRFKKYIQVENRHLRWNGEIEPIHRNEVPTENSAEKAHQNALPKLRIELNMADSNEFIDFLKTRKTVSQPRERTGVIQTKVNRNSQRSTFVAKDIQFDKSNIEVYVNGTVSYDIVCKVEETHDAYILYLSYKGGQGKRLTINKKDSNVPIRHIRYLEKENVAIMNGKNLAVTLEGYDAYKNQNSHRQSVNVTDSSRTTISKSKRERHTAISRQTTVKQTKDMVNVTIFDMLPQSDKDARGKKLKLSGYEEVISSSFISELMKTDSYDYLFGKESLPDKLLRTLFKTMRNDASKRKFMEQAQRSSCHISVEIDGIQYTFTSNIKIEELVHSGGSSLSQHCSFKKNKAHLLVDPKQQVLLLLSENRKLSAMLFSYKIDSWMTIAYFLCSFYSSGCRYKRSFLPLPVLKKFGIEKVAKVYKSNIENGFAKGQWFLMRSFNNPLQSRYYHEMINCEIIN